MTTKVALYCRVSTSTKDQTTENQRLELETYCDRMGYEVVKVYENDLTGFLDRSCLLFYRVKHIAMSLTHPHQYTKPNHQPHHLRIGVGSHPSGYGSLLGLLY